MEPTSGKPATPAASPSLAHRLLESGKKRKASPISAGILLETAELDALEEVRLAVYRLMDVMRAVDTGKETDRKLKKAGLEVEGKMETYANLRLSREDGPAPALGSSPEVADASTGMELTPEWWIPTQPVLLDADGRSITRGAARGAAQRRTRNVGVGSDDTDTDIGGRPFARLTTAAKAVQLSYASVAKTTLAETTDGEADFTTVTRRKKKARPEVAPAQPIPAALKRDMAPAVLVRNKDGASYAETVAAFKSAVDPTSLGANIAKIRRTREGHALIELSKSATSHAAAGRLSSAIAREAGERVGAVMQLGTLAEVEILDLDPTVSREEVLNALKAAVPSNMSDAEAERDLIFITGLWPIQSGTQIATAKMSRQLLNAMDRVKIGWTSARVRERAPSAIRCHKCHGFGHSSTSCTGPDLTGTCRRCGAAGHQEKDCTATDKICVACERSGIEVAAHRTGSARCAARRAAEKSLHGTMMRTVSGTTPRYA